LPSPWIFNVKTPFLNAKMLDYLFDNQAFARLEYPSAAISALAFNAINHIAHIGVFT
jgi:hypothetical protein